MKLADQDACTGCAACVNACPLGALAMRPDAEGFLQPVLVNGKNCVGCGKCETACPICNFDKVFPPQINKVPYCGCSLDEDIWRTSTSGGAFSEICFSLTEENPVVFGAKFEGRDKICHSFVDDVKQMSVFRKSKYVQSEVRDTLRQCKAFLDADRFVVFSGTPCQIAGLRAYLGRDYDKLLTVEFICHGVGSPSVFADSIKAIEKHRNRVMSEYQFRSKIHWPSHPYTSQFTWGDGDTEEIIVDLYNRFFLNQLCLRRSCMENCRFRQEKRCADITLADSRGESRLYTKKDDKNWSVVIANTDKGLSVLNGVKSRMMLRPYPLELLMEMNPLYFHTTKGSLFRREFFAQYLKRDDLFRIADRLDPRESFVLKLARKIFRPVKNLLKLRKRRKRRCEN